MLTAGMGLRVTRPLDRRTSLGVRFSPTMYDTRGSPALAIDVAAGWARGVGSASHRLFAEARGQLTVFDASGRRRGGWGGVAGGGDFAVARGAVRLRPFVGLHLGRQSVSVEQVRTTTTFNPFDGTSEVDETRSQTDRARTLGRIETGLTVWFGRRTVAPEAAYQPY